MLFSGYKIQLSDQRHTHNSQMHLIFILLFEKLNIPISGILFYIYNEKNYKYKFTLKKNLTDKKNFNILQNLLIKSLII